MFILRPPGGFLRGTQEVFHSMTRDLVVETKRGFVARNLTDGNFYV